MTVTLDQFSARVRAARRGLDIQVGEARTVREDGIRLIGEVADLTRRVDLHQQAAAVLASIGEERQAAAQQQVESLVTQGLKTIFSDELSFHLVQTKRKDNTTLIEFVVRSALADGSVVETDIVDEEGGGLAATVGFLLRLVVLLLSRDRQDTVLFLDETFAHVSAEYEPRLAEFLRILVDKTGVQIVLVTHSDAYSDAADVRYRFSRANGVTEVTAE